MRYISALFLAVALCVAGHGRASADIVNDCYRTTIENPVNNDRIISVCTQAISASSGNNRAAALSNRGIGYMQKGELDAALADFNEAISINPNDNWSRSSRANLFRLKRNYDRALSELNEIIRRDPNFIGAYADRGMVHQERGDVESARADYRAVLGMKSSNAEIERWAKDRARAGLEALKNR